MNSVFDLRTVLPYLHDLYPGIWMTVAVSLATMGLSLPLGLVVALGRRSGSRLTRFVSAAYVEFFRNTPLLVVLYFIYFMMPVIGLRFSPFESAVVGMSLHAGAYVTEILRAGLNAIPHGQYEAARSLGLSDRRVMHLVVLPQMLRIIYAPLGNQVISIILGSSLASAVAVNEIASWMQTAGAASFRYFEMFFVAGVVYLVLCQAVNLLRVQLGRVIFPAYRA